MDREAFLHLLGRCVERFDWILAAFVLMSNHFHFVVQLTAENLSRGMQWLNSTYSQHFNRRHERAGHVLQGRPDIRLIDHERYLREVMRYVVLNPVRAKMVARPEEYEWSSHRAVLGLAPIPEWLAVDDALVSFGPDRDIARAFYREFVDAGIALTESPWSGLVAQTYLGSETWIEDIRQRVRLKPRSEEHPRAQRFVPFATMEEIIRRVAGALSVDENQIRFGRGGLARTVAAWLAWYDGQLKASEIAAGLRLRSCGNVARLVERCEREMESRAELRAIVERLRIVEKAQLKI